MNGTQSFMIYTVGEYLNFLQNIGKYDEKLISDAKKEFYDISKQFLNENEADKFSRFLNL